MTHRKSDHNQAQIVQALRERGCSVVVLSDLGRGIPDLLIGYGGSALALIEVKNLTGRGLSLTPAEQAFVKTWQGTPVIIATSLEDIIDALGRR